jgi:hypothetical protein
MVPITNTMPGHISEFQNDAQLKKVLRDSCGDTALEVAVAMTEHRGATVADMENIYHHIYAAGDHHPGHNGTTLWRLARAAEWLKKPIAVEWDYSADFEKKHDWLKLLRDNAGKRPVVLFLTLAEKLIDAETGIGYSYRKPRVFDPKHHLHGHFICVVSTSEHGYVCADGANPQVKDRYAIYTAETLRAAQVRGVLMLDMPQPVEVPSNVSGLAYKADAGGNLTYERGSLKTGFSRWVQTHNYAADLLIPDTSLGNESFCVFVDGRVLYWSKATDVVDMGFCGPLVVKLFGMRKVA